MNKKTVGIIVTIATILLCGFPGLFMFLMGAITAMGKMPITLDFPYTSNFGSNSDTFAPTYVGYIVLGLALVFIAIPIILGILTLRKKPEKTDSAQ
jgi:hypothetical protein